MVFFFPILNHVNRITTVALNAIKIMEMNSRKSPYFTSKKDSEHSEDASPSKKQTRSSKQQTIKIKLDETANVNESANKKVKVDKAQKAVIPAEEKIKKPFFPENWETVLDNIKIMRAVKDAPVDQMGAEQCADSASSPEV